MKSQTVTNYLNQQTYDEIQCALLVVFTEAEKRDKIYFAETSLLHDILNIVHLLCSKGKEAHFQ